MAIGDLLMSQRRWGQTRCRKFLAQIPMSEQKTVGSMTERQRRTLAAMLSAGVPAIVVTNTWLTQSPVVSQRAAPQQVTAQRIPPPARAPEHVVATRAVTASPTAA